MNNKYRQARADQDKIDLLMNIKKKIQTTMIGALSSIEDHFNFLIQDDEKIREIYNKLRSEILDKGNKQIRYIEIDLENYSVSKNKNKNIPINHKD